MNLPLGWGIVILSLLLTLIGIEPVHAQSSVTTPLNNATSLPVGSCTATVPCSNGACCNGNSGFCGFGPDYCTPVASGGNCTSNCDAQAECGPYAPPANLTCPLNVCCSQYGFCGTTTDFCGTGCLSNCGNPVVPVCGAETNSALTRRIGYYNSAAAYRSCMAYPPEQIYTEDLTHVNFAFAYISDTFQVVEANPGDSQLWQRTTNLKSQNPTLQVFLTIGGWDFSNPPTSTIFSQLVASTVNTNIFIASVLSVMETYAFDGLDIDWEYPGAYDRGGGPADTENYVTFMAAVKSAFSSFGYGLSFTAPSSYWYLQHFDLLGLLESADWVNVMTYDLHGTWDGMDPYIGYVLDSATNLTEIDEAFDLYWRAGVNPAQTVMGFAFYGRSFTLASSGCWDPGCPWVSGGDPGPCSATAGILMFSEIESILNSTTSVQSVTDPVAAVNYMIWDTNQWVSYDNAETFQMKMSYANDHCIGGSMIWSVDQDDSNYDALTGMYGNSTQGIASGVTQGTGCLETDWNADGCPDGYSFVGSDQNLDGESRYICCESGNAPSPYSCEWGTNSVGSTCVPVCPPGDILLATSTSFCLSGSMPFCCATNVTAINNCVIGDCSSNPLAACPAGNASIFITTVINGDESSSSSTCTGGETKPFCCESDFPYENCTWVGTTPLCLDSGCAVGQVQLLSDPQGDGTQPCSGTGTRSYCCDPIGSAYVPVPFDDIFPSNVTEGAETFDVEFDPDVTNSPQADTLSNSTTTDNEETEAFGEIFIDSPNPQSVSSLAAVSDWVVTSCNAKSDQPQTVLAYCSKSMDNSGCAHVFIGSAEHTIVQMPRSCGLGPYARVASLVPHANQSILSAFHQAKKPASELVYSLSFDYDFSVIPESNGPIYMRADVTDMPDYWDSVVDSPPERKRWLQEQEMKKPILRRWWGAFTTWLSKLTTIEKTGIIARTFTWTDTWTIYENSVACPGSSTQPSFEASLDITLEGMASASASFGFYLQATVVPPSVQAAYLFLNTDASAYAMFTIQGIALVQYNSQNIQFASFGFPGLYYPGLITIGPSLVINGYLAGEISLEANIQLLTQVQFPPINIQLGSVGDNFTGTPTNFSSWAMEPPNTSFGVDVELAGDLSLHLVPTLQLGINILNGALVDAQAYVESDLYAGVSLNGTASLDGTPEVCYSAYYGVNFYGGLTGSLLYWESASAEWPIYQQEIPWGSQCQSLTSGSTKRDTSNRSLILPQDAPLGLQASERRPSAYIMETTEDSVRYIFPVSQHPTIDPAPVAEGIMKRQSSSSDIAVPTVPGTLLCPGNQGVNETNEDGDVYSDLPTLLDASEKRSWIIEDMAAIEELEFDEDDFLDDLFYYSLFDDEDGDLERRASIQPEQLARKVKIPGCGSLVFNALAYDKAATNDYWDLLSPSTLNGVYAVVAPSSIATSRTYSREHIYEIQLVAQFIGQLLNVPALWQNSGTSFCTWVSNTILSQPISTNLAQCLPNNQAPNGYYMPWLEAWANGVKARAFVPKTIFAQDTFNDYTDSKKVAVMRATSGLISYMNDGKVSKSFIAQSQCIRKIWANFDPTGATTTLYDSWIQGKLYTFNSQILTGMSNMVTWWNTDAGSSTALVNVVLGYSNYVSQNPSATNGQASGQQLQTNVANLVTNGITWINQL